MRPATFEYLAPESLAEATEEIARLAPDGKFLAGGQSLVPLMNFRLAQPPALVDLRRVPELAGISVGSDEITIGAMTTHAEIERSEELAQALPIARAAARQIGHPAIRNAGTIGGSLVHADPAAEWPVVLTALGARVRVESTRGGRWIAVPDLFLGYFMTTIEADELLTSIVIPRPGPAVGWSFQEFARQSGAFGLVLVAALAAQRAGRVESAQVVLGGCAGTPVVVDGDSVGELARLCTERTWAEAASRVVAAVDSWTSDIHATGEDRRQIATALVRRALAEACGEGSTR